ncbi:Eco29kI restriction endonuclease [Amycolatopsis marina]|uniref:Eco29kI restriction endonuclease n=1 Tax=Amycolatopsis marina TaxID=490629 RepID=A0A1I1CGJ2_9PSEU|nr:Eco29kI family restriction endonuclease [Amycolatopsis marina]SFB61674.1 Eco29kI restriction endonuclease [Amycolatopsis marina]
MPYNADFRLSITRALRDQLADSIEALSPAALTSSNIGNLDARPGVYQLYHYGDLVYIGKADGSLPSRLREHHVKILGRTKISLQDMSFTCLYVEEDLSAVAPETLLIQRHRGAGEVPWNYNGFGNHDPGKQRDTTTVRGDHFDALYPIDLRFPCGQVEMISPTVRDVLTHLRSSLPYTFRHEGNRQAVARQPAEFGLPCPLPNRNHTTADDLFSALAAALPPGWQITALPGYVIMYKEQRAYASTLQTYRS